MFNKNSCNAGLITIKKDLYCCGENCLLNSKCSEVWMKQIASKRNKEKNANFFIFPFLFQQFDAGPDLVNENITFIGYTMTF